jgi:hypothetical protein
MARVLSMLLWSAVFLLLLAGIDQLLVRAPASHPAHVAVATFYRDLRSRLIDLAGETLVAQPPVWPAKTVPPAPGPPSAKGEQVIKKPPTSPLEPPSTTAATPAKPKPAWQTPEPSPRYLYADERGELRFADTLAEIPEPYRDKARRLGE